LLADNISRKESWKKIGSKKLNVQYK